MIGFLLLLAAAPTQAQAQAVDSGTFVVRRDTTEIARETFQLTRGGLTAGGTGWRLATVVRYGRPRPAVTLAPILEVADDTLPQTLQYDVAERDRSARILGQLGPGRFTVRVVARASERAREFPATGATVVLDDSVPSLYVFAAWLAGGAPRTVNAIVPRALRHDAIVIRDLGQGSERVGGAAATLRHVQVTGGPPGTVDLWLDREGRLVKVACAGTGITAERLPLN
ncbi:MAG TPA: hypothetical protein VFK78_02230 [Gemmatimonadales bacterium]|nr:hypothetical protein [Gemmatimonadales bacterium]